METIKIVKVRFDHSFTIPKELDIPPGAKYLVKTDEAGRIIYEPVKLGMGDSS